MTERYAHNAPENARAAVERLDALAQTGHTFKTVLPENVGNYLKELVGGTGIEPVTPAV